VSAAAQRKLRARNATEDAILAAAREALVEDGYEKLTIDGIARRAFTSRTNVYFYFANKRAVVDRLVQQTFAEMLVAGSPYLDGTGEPRHELRKALGRVVLVVNRNADILLLVGHLSGMEDRLPAEWEPYIRRFVNAAEARIRRDQERGVAPADIPPFIAAQALCAMVERHVTMEIIRGGRQITESVRVLSELWWRAVYSHPGRRARGTRHPRAGSPR
jgi:TetR/AcrR family transcriptional regulator, ethionamide resistance regulator